MRDILEELGLNFKSHSLSDSGFEYAVHNYVEQRKNFQEALHNVVEVFSIKSKSVPVKTFINNASDAADQLAFWQEVNDFIKLHENDNWIFDNLVKDVTDLNNDPYDDYEDLYETVTVYAYIKSDDQPTTEEQQNALNYLSTCERNLIFAKEDLGRYLK